MPGLSDLIKMRRTYSVFGLATLGVVLWDSPAAVMAVLIVHVLVWIAVVHELTLDIRNVRSAQARKSK